MTYGRIAQGCKWDPFNVVIQALTWSRYLVLEFVDNGELFEHISKSGRLEEDEAVRYFRQMLSAIGY